MFVADNKQQELTLEMLNFVSEGMRTRLYEQFVEWEDKDEISQGNQILIQGRNRASYSARSPHKCVNREDSQSRKIMSNFVQ